MASIAQLDFARQWLAFDTQCFAYDRHLFPAVADLAFIGVLGIRFFDKEIGLIGADDGEAPGNALIMANGDAREAWLAGADDVPAGSMKVDEVAQRGQGDGAVRVARQERHAGYRAR